MGNPQNDAVISLCILSAGGAIKGNTLKCGKRNDSTRIGLSRSAWSVGPPTYPGNLFYLLDIELLPIIIWHS